MFSGAVLDVGCGTGEHTILAARHGARALGLDISQVAIQSARVKAAAAGVDARFDVANALDLHEIGPFDVALDSGFFHTLPDDQRTPYAANLARVLRVGGTLVITCFSEHQSGTWGAHRVRESELRRTFVSDWQIEELRLCDRVRRPETGNEIAKAWLAIVRRTGGTGPCYGED
jgi:SAM-dependent methyltransferase